ncbi:MAG: aminoacyl-tRNA hydrolase [Planctomycetota bacterium]
MKVVLGIGNPGPRYAGTRHNLGWRVVETLAAAWKVRLRRCNDCWVDAVRALCGGEEVVLLRPRTYVNETGRAARASLERFRCDVADLLVIADDLNLPVGRMRFRRGGSSGGHRGLESIIGVVGADFARLRLGIGANVGVPSEVYVLEPFPAAERPLVEESVEQAAEAVAVWVTGGMDACMNRYN